MSATIDNRVVQMSFDNKNFETNVATSMSTIDKLKQKLNFTGASKGLENLTAAARNVDLSNIDKGVDSLSNKFSTLQVAAGVALGNIATKAISVGSEIAKALTVEPLISGLKEYELQLNSVQTILANTQHKGTNIDQVNNALDQLNTYADKTIYNFGEMTKNIGTFTAAGVGLEQSVSAIKGIANLAAMSGSSSAQASQAMYQLSQALAAGRVSLMDWNSVVNAGMGGEVFQNALKRTARNMGIAVDEIIDKYGSFRESLTEGQWLTTDVLTETLAQLSGAYTEADLIAQGYTESQAKEILQLAETAENAATQVKTFSQLIDTSKEALQSGWSESWRLILGDFEEAKELFTGISNTLGEMISESADYRNAVLQGWHDLGGRDDLIQSMKNAFEGLVSVVKPVKEAFRDIFPRISTQNLLDFTSGLKDLTAKMKISNDSSVKLKTTFKGLFSILDIGKDAVMAVVKPLFNFATGGTVSSIGNAILTITSKFGLFFIKLREGIKEGEAFSSVSDVISTALSGVGSAVEFVIDLVGGMGDAFGAIGDIVSSAFSGIVKGISTVLGWLATNISAGDIFAGLSGLGFLKVAKKITSILDPIKEAVSSLFDGGLKDSVSGFKDLLGSVGDSLVAFQQGVKVASLVAIAGALTLLSHAIRTLSEIDAGSLVISLGALGAMMLVLNNGFKGLVNILDDFDAKGTIKAGLAMIAMAEAINILADAIEQLSSLSFGDIAQGLIAVGASTAILVTGVNAISKSDVSLKTSVALIALAGACKILASALEDFAEINILDTAQGLIAMGLALGEVVLALKAVDKLGNGGLKGAASLLIAVQSLNDIAEALSDIGALSWGEITHGLVGMGLALAELAIISGTLGNLAGAKGLVGATALVVAVQSLDELAEALSELGSLSWGEVAVGLVAMGGALTELGIITGLLGNLAGLPAILGGTALLVAVQSLGDLADAMLKFGSMSFGQTVTALIGMGGALTELGVITGLLGSIAGLPALLGGGAILLAVQGLGDLADALKKFGEMSWGEIIKGLTSMALAMGATALGGVINSLSGIGASAISEVAGPLGTLADSVRKWAGVVVPETIGTQLASLAKGIRAFSFGEWGAENLALAVEPLGQLAGAIQKWSGVVIPEELGVQLSSLASGIKAFTFAFIGAEALAIAATGLSLLADALKKFQDMELTGVGLGITELSNGLRDLGTVGIQELVTGFQNAALNIKTKAGEIVTDIRNMMTNFASAISNKVGEITQNVQTIMGNIYNTVSRKATEVVTAVKTMMTNFVSAISEKLSSATSAMTNIMNGVKSSISNKASEVISAIKTVMSSFVSAISEKASAAGTAMGKVVDTVKSTASNAVQGMYSVGVNVAQGLINGIGSMVQAAASAAASLASAAVRAAKSALSIKSPSRVFMEIGVYVVEGFNKGISDNLTSVSSTGDKLANTLINGVNNVSDDVEDIAKNQNGIGKEALFSFMNGVLSQLNISGEELVQTADMIMLKFVDAIASKQVLARDAMMRITNTIETVAMNSVGVMYNIGVSLGYGVINGIRSMIAEAAAAAAALAKAASNAAKANLKIHSPSKVFFEIGENVVDGFVLGIQNNLSDILNSGSKMGDKLVNSVSTLSDEIGDISSEQIKNGEYAVNRFVQGVNKQLPHIILTGEKIGNNMLSALTASVDTFELGEYFIDHTSTTEGLRIGLMSNIDKIIQALNDDLDMEPTIRPIVDLSDVKGKSRIINTMFSRQLAVYASNNGGRSTFSQEDIPSKTNQNGNSYQFIQNNYSPKALSRVEIYRQTKNQFSNLKGVLES